MKRGVAGSTTRTMKDKPAAIFFDKNDYQLLDIVNDIRERGAQSHTFRSLLVEYMHPHGIKEMAAARGLRIAYAVAGLLGSLESGKAKRPHQSLTLAPR